jgi:hypothetical protein
MHQLRHVRHVLPIWGDPVLPGGGDAVSQGGGRQMRQLCRTHPGGPDPGLCGYLIILNHQTHSMGRDVPDFKLIFEKRFQGLYFNTMIGMKFSSGADSFFKYLRLHIHNPLLSAVPWRLLFDDPVFCLQCGQPGAGLFYWSLNFLSAPCSYHKLPL